MIYNKKCQKTLKENLFKTFYLSFVSKINYNKNKNYHVGDFIPFIFLNSQNFCDYFFFFLLVKNSDFAQKIVSHF